jgi:hypothetical protein
MIFKMKNGVFCDLSKATKKCPMQLNILNCIQHFLIALHKLQQTQFFIMKPFKLFESPILTLDHLKVEIL